MLGIVKIANMFVINHKFFNIKKSKNSSFPIITANVEKNQKAPNKKPIEYMGLNHPIDQPVKWWK